MARVSVDETPIYTKYLNSYSKEKTENGYTFNSAFLKRYYSMLDAEIYFGNEYVEDVVDINWAVTQTQLPLFGFNSYTYDEVALGSRIIQGNFVINFTSPNYLFDILKIAEGDSITNMTSYEVVKSKEELIPSEKNIHNTENIVLNDRQPIWPQSFDIDAVFGGKTSKGDPVHIVLEGVMIKDSRIGVGISDGPIMEIYSFIARDLQTVV